MSVMPWVELPFGLSVHLAMYVGVWETYTWFQWSFLNKGSLLLHCCSKTAWDSWESSPPKNCHALSSQLSNDKWIWNKKLEYILLYKHVLQILVNSMTESWELHVPAFHNVLWDRGSRTSVTPKILFRCKILLRALLREGKACKIFGMGTSLELNLIEEMRYNKDRFELCYVNRCLSLGADSSWLLLILLELSGHMLLTHTWAEKNSSWETSTVATWLWEFVLTSASIQENI